MIAEQTPNLAKSMLFVGVGQSKVARYTERFVTNIYPARSLVFAQGDSARYLYVISAGRVKLTRITEDGREIVVGFFGTNELVGEDVLLGNKTFRSTSARCMDDSVVCAIRADEFRSITDSCPQVVMNVARHFAEQRDAALASIEDIAGLQVSKRLVRALQRLAVKYGTDSERGRQIDVRLTHAEMATLIGSTRETVSLEVNNLVRSGQLVVHGHYFFLPFLNAAQPAPEPQTRQSGREGTARAPYAVRGRVASSRSLRPAQAP
jgi:CRP/FNR family transcriptional regulator, cyclic AMP receptor protein